MSFFLNFRYPVIISIENHCSPEPRYFMARMFVEIFGGEFSIEVKEMKISNENMLSRISSSVIFISR
jgi:hypothetical protein